MCILFSSPCCNLWLTLFRAASCSQRVAGLLEAKGMWHVKRFSGMSWPIWCLPLGFVRKQTQHLISPFKQTVIALLGMRDKN